MQGADKESSSAGRSTARLLLQATLPALAVLLEAGCGGSSLPAGATPLAAPTPPRPSRVVILSMDGLRPDGLEADGVSHIPALMRRGVVAQGARTVFPPITLPAHTSMLTGYLPSVHGVIWNDWSPGRGPRVPTIFALARAAGFRTVMVAGKAKFRQFGEAGGLDAFVLASGDVAVANEAVVQVQAGFDLMFVHLPDVDTVGHLSGWISPAYLEQVAESDRAVGRILAALPPGTTVILTADHGGHDKTHGLDQPTDMLIPWIIAGPDVIQGGLLPPTIKVSSMDTAATALHLLGLALPANAGGRPVLAAFRGSQSRALGPAA